MWIFRPRCRSSVRMEGICTLLFSCVRHANKVQAPFMRNRPELELLVRLLCHKSGAAPVNLTVLGCSKGAEVYSISYALRSAYPDLKVNIQALDISLDVVEFAKGEFTLSDTKRTCQILRQACLLRSWTW